MSKSSVKGDIVKEYLQEYPESPSLTLARLIYNENKSVFNDVESVRTTIRYYRGARGGNQPKDRRFIREFTKDLYNPFKLPESDELEFEPYIITGKKILVMGDLHIPYHSISAITVTLKYAKEKQVDTILLNGDIMDFHQLSSFIRDPRKRHFSEEKQAAIDFLEVLRNEFPDAKIIWKQGNHSERLETYLKVKAPELFGDPEFEIDAIFKFGKFGVEYVKDKRTIKAGKLNILHGHELKGGIIQPVNPARGVFMRTGVQTLVNHFHRTSQHTDPNLDDDLISCWSIGCLCDIHPEWMPNNKWNHGAAIVSVFEDGDFNVDNFMINGTKIFRA